MTEKEIQYGIHKALCGISDISTTAIEEYESSKIDRKNIRLVDEDNWTLKDFNSEFGLETLFHYTKDFYNYSGEYVLEYTSNGDIYEFVGWIGKSYEITIIRNCIFVAGKKYGFRIENGNVYHGKVGSTRYELLDKSDYEYRTVIDKIKYLYPKLIKLLEVRIVQDRISEIIKEVM